MSYVSLDLCSGPECPRCGCQDAKILDPPRPESEVRRDGWFGSQRRGPRVSSSQPAVELPRPPGINHGNGEWWAPGQAVCRHCRKTFFFRQRAEPDKPPAEAPDVIATEEHSRPPTSVPFYLVGCPACGSTDTRVTSTTRPVRRHKCCKCGHPFKSVERKQ